MHAFGVHGTEVIKKRRAIMISIKSLGLTTGILGACTMFFLSWWLILTGNADGPVTFFERVYIGYSYTPMGSIIGAVWGCIDWGIAGMIFAWLYNKINNNSFSTR